MNKPILSTNAINKNYQDGKNSLKKVLCNINLKLYTEDTVAIVGPSGSGKSTLLNIMAGLDKPSSGSVHFLDNNITAMGEISKCKLRSSYFGFVHQNPYLLKDFSVIENIMMPLLIQKKNIKFAKIESQKLLERVSLSNLENRRIQDLSGGEKQRISILRSLANSPKVLFADEPTAHLDRVNAINIFNFIMDLKNTFKFCFIIVSHDEYLIKGIRKKFILLDGEIKDEY